MSAGIAITGMSCLFAGAPDLDAYWQNIVDKVDAVGDPPPDAWDANLHYDPDFADTDKVYCRRGGYLGSLVRFDPLAHGIPPVAVGGEPDQWLALKLARDALADAGQHELSERTRHRTAVVIGKGTYLNAGNALAIQRALIIEQTLEFVGRLQPDLPPDAIELLRAEMKRVLPAMGAETVAGLIPNIIAGRIANKLDLMGPTYTVDAACASSLVAIEQAIGYLRGGHCDLALAGGAQVWMPVPTLNVFSHLGALSRTEQIRPFDKDADGTLLGEGIGMIVLKRLADAQRDGDRIYAVIRSIGIASDGRGAGVMAPRVEGQELALRRAYEQAGVAPRTVGLLEAHGTATRAGDVAEIQTLRRVFGDREGGLPHCALGTVKSMISHTMPASGIAGIIKLALALHHQVLPPTLHCDEVNPELELERTHFYINTETRPWIHGGSEPRRAAINAFGFGGINTHALLEEVVPPGATGRIAGPDGDRLLRRDHLPRWDSEAVILESDSATGLREKARRLASALGDHPDYELTDIAYTCARRLERFERRLRLAIVASSLDDLRAKLQRAAGRLDHPGCRRMKDVSGIYFASQPLARDGRLAFLFPGEGAQYPAMLDGLCLHFPEVREVFDRADRVYFGHPRGFVPSDHVFPRPAFTDDQRRASERRLMEMDSAIEAVLTANRAMLVLLGGLALRPDVCVGHSTGEVSAAMAGGLIEFEDDRRLSEFMLSLYGEYAAAAAQDELPRAVLLAVGAGRERIEAVAREAGDGIALAIDNAPHQTVLIGTVEAAERAIAILRREGMIFERLAYNRAVHTPSFAAYSHRLAPIFADVATARARVPVHSCATTEPYPGNEDEIRRLLVDQWQQPVEFRATIERLYADGVRLFVEVGPRGNLTAFVQDILRGREFCAVPSDVQRRSSVTQLNHLVAMLSVHGVDLDLEYLFARRGGHEIDWTAVTAAHDRPTAMVSLMTNWPALRLSEQVVRAVAVKTPAMASTAPPATPVIAAITPPAAPPSDASATSSAPGFAQHAVGAAPVEDARAVPAASAAPATASAMIAHLETMDRFLAVDGDIMRRFLEACAPAPRLDDVADRLVERTILDAGRDSFLRDHSFGSAVSRTDDTLQGMAVVPLTMSLDMMAATAARLAPGLHVTGLRDVYARRWLAIEDEPLTIELVAQRLPANGAGQQIEVRLWDLTAEAHDSEGGPAPAVEATVLLDTTYPVAPAVRTLDPAGARRSRWTQDSIYTDGMFHGPTWRGVQAVQQTADHAVTASLRVLPVPHVVDAAGMPLSVLDAVALDAAGQVIGLWAAEQLQTANVIFPFRLRALDVYGPPRPAGEMLACTAAVETGWEQTLRSDIDLAAGDGALWMRLTGWEDKRFDVPPSLRALLLGARSTPITSRWRAPIDGLSGEARLACRRLATKIESDRHFWMRVWSRRVLGRAERARFAALRAPEKRRLEWLAARTAAKEAIQEIVRDGYDLDLLAADIEIHVDDTGAPVVRGPWLAAIDEHPVVSLSHAGGMAVAVAGLSGGKLRVGVDVEPLRPRPGLAAAAFGDEERLLMESVAPDDVDEWMLRCWCAKEAVAKALGTGLVAGPASLTIASIDPGRQTITVLPAEALIASIADPPADEVIVRCVRQGPLVAAATVCQPALREPSDLTCQRRI